MTFTAPAPNYTRNPQHSNQKPNMSTTSHTPGPWIVEKPYQQHGMFISGPNTGLICKLYSPDVHLCNLNIPVSVEANARLIAAAPELLAALYDALHFVEDMETDLSFKNGIVKKHVATIRAAIAKAEGAI
jgi:hypothetical protein